MQEVSGSELFLTRPAKRRSSPWLLVIASASTLMVIVLALYVAVLEHPLTSKHELPAITARGPKPGSSSAMTSAPEKILVPPLTELPHMHLQLSNEGDFIYEYSLTLEQVQAALPSVPCSAAQGEPGKTSCTFSSAEERSKACAFITCAGDEMIVFSEDGSISSAASELDAEDWVRLKAVMTNNDRFPPATSEAILSGVIEHYTCFRLMDGSLKFSFASGDDMYGRPIAHPYAVYYEVSGDCTKLPGQATSG